MMQETTPDLFSIFYKTTWNKDISSVNEWIRTASNRWKGFHTMELALSRCSEDLILKHGISWIEIAAATVVKNHVEESVRSVAAGNFVKLLLVSSQISSVSRDLSSNHIVNILQQILLSSTDNPAPCLTCLEAIMDHFPAPCNAHKGKISKFLFPHAMSLNSSIQNVAISCWSKVSLLGGGGVGRKNHAQQWEQQFQETIGAWSFVTSCLWESRLEEGDADPSIASLSFHFEPLPVMEPDLTFALLRRFCMLCMCLAQMLTLDFPLPVAVSLDAIFNILLTNFDITPKAVKLMESKLYLDCLQTVHVNCLHVLKACIESDYNHLCRRADQVNCIFLNLLTMWKDHRPVNGLDKENNVMHLKVYQTILHWLQSAGMKSRLLMGKKHLVQPLLQHFVDDFYPISETQMQPHVPITINSTGNKKKSKRAMNSDVSFSKIVDSLANSQLCEISLRVLRVLVYSNGSRLPSFVHEVLQRRVVLLLMELIQGKEHIPYTSCAACRKELYHLLMALTVVPCPQYPAPVQLSVTIVSHGCSKDPNRHVRSFCVEANAVLANIVRPRVPALNRVCPSFDLKANVHESLQPIGQSDHVEEDCESAESTVAIENQTNLNADNVVNFHKRPTPNADETTTEGIEEPMSLDSIPQTSVHHTPTNTNSPPKDFEITTADDEDDFTPLTHTQTGHMVAPESCDDVPETVGTHRKAGETTPMDRLERGIKRKFDDKTVDSIITETNSSEEQGQLADDVAAMLEDFVDASPDDDDADGDTQMTGSGVHDLV